MMKTNFKLAFLFMLAVAPLTAFGIPFTFSYEFDDGTSLTGQLEGIIQSDNDTIEVVDFSNVAWNGFLFPEIEPNEILAVSDFQVALLPPTVSFSGTIFDLFVCPLGFNQNNNCSFSSEGGFLLGLIASFGQGPVPAYGIGDGQGNGLIGPLNPLNWSISRVTTNDVPEPQTVILMMLGVLSTLYFARRPTRNGSMVLCGSRETT